MKKICMVAVALALVGCDPGEEPKTTAWYTAHPDEMKAVLKKCQDKGVSPIADNNEARDCRTASTAMNDRFFQWKK